MASQDSQVQQLKKTLSQKDLILTKTVEERSSLKGVLDGNLGHITELENNNRELVRTVEKMRGDHQLQNELNESKRRSMQSQIDSLHVSLTTCRAEADSLRNTITGQVGQLSAFESTITLLKSQIQTSEQQNQDKADKIKSYLHTIREQEEKIKELEEKARSDENIRRALHNSIQELKGNIRVFCRVRPPKDSTITSAEDDVNFMYPTNTDNRSLEIQFNSPSGVAGKLGAPKKQIFQFDKVFQPATTQTGVFTEISQLVQSVLDGYNTCIFTYGQTGSGKTFTMEGPPKSMENASHGLGYSHDENRGMIPRTVEQIFSSAIALESKGWKYEMEAFFIEIYNETIRDLLSKNGEAKHEIKHTENGITYVSGITTVKVEDPSKVYELLALAATNRSVGRTNCNERSSRSHSVFQLKLRGHNTFTDEKTNGILNLIDLAGSERLKESGATGDRLKETQSINKSLSCLGDVIYALANKDSHIPYRNSKLTHLLQNCLGGNSKTLMFVNISPDPKDLNETVSSLRFATKVNACEIGTARKQVKLDGK
eukprot:TRINITY_DN20388_c0_g1_i1.p1 TRINITY_DN20388_c0_g1~~TRINITY_DN20388_c0_g1_i1.p1  ORF type:complete len:565 (+),score=107.70 TRINITY_DN20388_c0_g1_i1:69-1697(+)